VGSRGSGCPWKRRKEKEMGVIALVYKYCMLIHLMALLKEKRKK
jgi:hypothetical protein